MFAKAKRFSYESTPPTTTNFEKTTPQCHRFVENQARSSLKKPQSQKFKYTPPPASEKSHTTNFNYKKSLFTPPDTPTSQLAQSLDGSQIDQVEKLEKTMLNHYEALHSLIIANEAKSKTITSEQANQIEEIVKKCMVETLQSVKIHKGDANQSNTNVVHSKDFDYEALIQFCNTRIDNLYQNNKLNARQSWFKKIKTHISLQLNKCEIDFELKKIVFKPVKKFMQEVGVLIKN